MRLVLSWLGGGPAQRPLTTLLAREQIVSSNNDQRLRHRAPYRDASLCAQPAVALVDWPSDCSALVNVDGDCGRTATEDTLSDLMTAFCAVD